MEGKYHLQSSAFRSCWCNETSMRVGVGYHLHRRAWCSLIIPLEHSAYSGLPPNLNPAMTGPDGKPRYTFLLPTPTNASAALLVGIPISLDSPSILQPISIPFVFPSRPLPRDVTPSMSPFLRKHRSSRLDPHLNTGLEPLGVPIEGLSLASLLLHLPAPVPPFVPVAEGVLGSLHPAGRRQQVDVCFRFRFRLRRCCY